MFAKTFGFEISEDFVQFISCIDSSQLQPGDLFLLAPGHSSLLGSPIDNKCIITLEGDFHAGDMRDRIASRASSFNEYSFISKEDLEPKHIPPMGRGQKAHDRILAMNTNKFGRK